MHIWTFMLIHILKQLVKYLTAQLEFDQIKYYVHSYPVMMGWAVNVTFKFLASFTLRYLLCEILQYIYNKLRIMHLSQPVQYNRITVQMILPDNQPILCTNTPYKFLLQAEIRMFCNDKIWTIRTKDIPICLDMRLNSFLYLNI